MKLFIPITKVDAAQRLVYGKIASQMLDHSGEMFDYATSKPLFEKWSEDISKATDGKSVGNVRAMHGNIAAGKLTAISFNDENGEIEGCAKVIDDGEWNKVLEGVYTGFSMGGKYVKRWKEGDAMRYTAQPVEVSLVDLPCIPDATFSVIKAEGEPELRKFISVVAPVTPNAGAVAVRAGELAKAAGDEKKWTDFIEEATRLLKAEGEVAEVQKALKDGLKDEELKPAEQTAEEAAAFAKAAGNEEPKPEGDAKAEDQYEQVWKSNIDGKTFKKKADLLAHHEALAAAAKEADNPLVKTANDILAALDKKKPEAAAQADLTKAVDAYNVSPSKLARRTIIKLASGLGVTLPAELAIIKSDDNPLRKNLYFVGALVNMLNDIECMEDCYEDMMGADKATADRFGSLVVEFGDIVATILDAHLSDIKDEERSEIMQLSAEVETLMKAVRGKDKENLQKAHDALSSMGADCAASKAAAADALAKMTGERDQLAKTVAAMEPLLPEVLKRVKNIEEQPAGVSVPSTLRIIEKGQDNGGENIQSDDLEAKIAKMAPEEAAKYLANLAIKISHQQPKRLSMGN